MFSASFPGVASRSGALGVLAAALALSRPCAGGAKAQWLSAEPPHLQSLGLLLSFFSGEFLCSGVLGLLAAALVPSRPRVRPVASLGLGDLLSTDLLLRELTPSISFSLSLARPLSLSCSPFSRLSLSLGFSSPSSFFFFSPCLFSSLGWWV